MSQKFSEKPSENHTKFVCEKCDYICYKKSDYMKHLSTLKHNTARIIRKSLEKFSCKFCDFVCCYQSDYQRHISSLKHKKREKVASTTNNDTEDNKISYNCDVCDYSCRYKSLFDKHLGTVKHIKNVENNTNTNEDTNKTEQLSKIIEQQTIRNEELQTFLIQQQQQYNLQMKEQQDLYQNNMKEQQEQHNKQIQELLPKLQQVTNINNTNNTKFNLNFFLNEQCKDAISIQTFMRDLNIGIKELEHMGNVGYLQGMISIMSNTLCAMDIYKRPVHCTDLKRETIYIKDGDTWKKDNANNDDLKKVIDDVADVNYRNLQLWETQHPEAFECDTPDNIEYCKIALESLGGGNNNEEQAASKLKKIVKHVVRDLYVK